jgi:hypothetical protein
MKWAVLLWSNRTRKARVMGFVEGEHQPEALGEAMKEFPAARHDRNYFVRPAWDGAPNHYSTVPLDE